MTIIYSRFELMMYLTFIQASEWAEEATIEVVQNAINKYTSETNANRQDLSEANIGMEETTRKLQGECRTSQTPKKTCVCEFCDFLQTTVHQLSTRAKEAEERMSVLEYIVDTLRDILDDKNRLKNWDPNLGNQILRDSDSEGTS